MKGLQEETLCASSKKLVVSTNACPNATLATYPRISDVFNCK